jgi:membrane protease YdiL (CAAX protease family)
MYIVLIIVQVFLLTLTNINWDDHQVAVRLNSIINLSFYGVMVFLYLVIFRGFWEKVIIQFKQNRNNYLRLIGLGVVSLLVVSALINLGYQLIGVTETSDNQAALDALLSGSWFDKFSLVMFAVFLAPLVEEMVFRMATFNLLFSSAKLKPWTVIVISSLLFGLIHVAGTLDFIQIFYYAGLGMVLGYFYYKSKNIAVPIAIHMLLNAIVTVTMFVL